MHADKLFGAWRVDARTGAKKDGDKIAWTPMTRQREGARLLLGVCVGDGWVWWMGRESKWGKGLQTWLAVLLDGGWQLGWGSEGGIVMRCLPAGHLPLTDANMHRL